MAVLETTSTNGAYRVFSSINSTLATAISEVINELDTQHISMSMIKFVFTFDDTGQEYIFMAVCKKGSGTPY